MIIRSIPFCWNQLGKLSDFLTKDKETKYFKISKFTKLEFSLFNFSKLYRKLMMFNECLGEGYFYRDTMTGRIYLVFENVNQWNEKVYISYVVLIGRRKYIYGLAKLVF